MKENPDEPRIDYNLGRVSSLEAESIADEEAQAAKLIEAQKFYGNALVKIAEEAKETDPNQKTDPALVSVIYVAIARLYEFFNQNDMALQAYDRALKIGDIEDGAFNEAMAGKQNLIKKP